MQFTNIDENRKKCTMSCHCSGFDMFLRSQILSKFPLRSLPLNHYNILTIHHHLLSNQGNFHGVLPYPSSFEPLLIDVYIFPAALDWNNSFENIKLTSEFPNCHLLEFFVGRASYFLSTRRSSKKRYTILLWILKVEMFAKFVA